MKNNLKNELLRNIPQVDEILNEKDLIFIIKKYSHDYVLKVIRECINDYKSDLLNENNNIEYNYKYLIEMIIKKFDDKERIGIRNVINATGTVLHTNLGRSLLSENAISAICNVAKEYSDLEYNLDTGKRGNRNNHIEKIIKNILNVESAIVVNNNAAATILVLSSMCYGKNVLVSRGELIEIGDSFRIPEIMSLSGAELKEIGTTNITKANDYIKNIDENTSALMKVHTSNYRIYGFTENASIEEIVSIGRDKGLPVIYDMGNGLFNDLSKYNIDEPTIKDIINKGVDVLLFSGDKLLGGPQAGIIVGKKEYIDKMKHNPFMRAFRADKFTLASLGATLKEYYNEDQSFKNIPVLNMISKNYNDLINDAKEMSNEIKKINNKISVSIIDTNDQIGGGTAPNVFLKGAGVSVKINNISTIKLENDLRNYKMPIISRLQNDSVVFVMRTLDKNNIKCIIDFFKDYDYE